MLPTSSRRNWRGWDERCSRLVAQLSTDDQRKVLVVDKSQPSEPQPPREIENNSKSYQPSIHSLMILLRCLYHESRHSTLIKGESSCTLKSAAGRHLACLLGKHCS